DLNRYSRQASRDSEVEDIVVAAARQDWSSANGLVTVFGSKTQGHPYHLALLAAAMLVEERFPQHAMASGNIDRGQAERARTMAARILGRDLELPVRVDPLRLLDRLRARYVGSELVSAFERTFLGEAFERHEGMLRVFPGPEGARHWLRELAGYETPRKLGAIGLLVAWLNA